MFGIIRLKIFSWQWRRNNKHNFTKPSCLFPINSVKVGIATYGNLYVLDFGGKNQLSIGNYCSVGPHVTFVLQADHYLNHATTYPIKVKILGEKSEAISKGNIIVDDDVWIGCNAVILSGTHIGKGAVIAAASIVTHDVPPYAIVAGNPAKIIKYRFSEKTRSKLLSIDYGRITPQTCKKNVSLFYKELDDMSDIEANELISELESIQNV